MPALRGWLGRGTDRTVDGAAAPQDLHATVPAAVAPDQGAGCAPDAGLRAAQATASRALWRHALGVRADQPADPRALRELRSGVERVLAGELAERYFPRRPLLMPRLMAAVRDPASAATRLADIIAQDPVLAGDVLRLANSAWYRVTRDPVETLQRAVIVCGTDGLQSLASLALMQPVFRNAAAGSARLPQLLVLLRALGPLVVYRIVEEQSRERPAGAGEALACATLLEECGGQAAARVAIRWDSSERICAVLAELDGQGGMPLSDEVQRDLAVAVEVGELLGTTSVLLGERVWDSAAGLRIAAESAMPRDWMLATLTRLGRA